MSDIGDLTLVGGSHYLAGMGDDNIEEFGAAVESEEPLTAFLGGRCRH